MTSAAISRLSLIWLEQAEEQAEEQTDVSALSSACDVCFFFTHNSLWFLLCCQLLQQQQQLLFVVTRVEANQAAQGRRGNQMLPRVEVQPRRRLSG